MDFICSLPHWQLVFIAIASQVSYMFLEAWLGVTNKVESGSVLEVIWSGIKQLLKKKENL
jgi:hypothetical protein